MIDLLKVIAWPAVALTAIWAFRPILKDLVPGSKLKISIAGVSIETTIPELKNIITEQIGPDLTKETIKLLEGLGESGALELDERMPKDQRQLYRPLRNAGLIMTLPRHTYLGEAKSIQLTELGRLYIRARRKRAA